MRAVDLLIIEGRGDVKDLGDVRLWAVDLPRGLPFKLGFGVAVAEQAIGYGDPDDEKVEELPASGEDGLVDEFRGLRKKKRKEGDEDGEEDGFVEETRVEFS